MSNYLDLLAKIALEFSNESIIISLLIIGYIWINKDIFFHGVCLVLISMIINSALKATFQIPLNPSLGKEGFAFPSGHMQTSVVLYGFFYTFIKNRALKCCLLALLTMIGASLIYFGYHDFVDVVGAVVVALLIMFLYKNIIINRLYLKSRYLSLMQMFVVSIFLVYIKLIYSINPYVWMAYYALFGFLIAHEYCVIKLKTTTPNKLNKFLASGLCFTCLFYLDVIFSSTSSIIELISPFRWFFMGVAVPCALFVSNLICTRVFKVNS